MIEISFAATVTFIVLLFASREPRIFHAVLAGYAVRLTAAIINVYIMRLPDGAGDALEFERVAWNLASLPWKEYLASFSLMSGDYAYGWLIAFIYRFVGRIELVPQMINVLLGTLAIVFAYRSARLVWRHRVAVHVAWVAALFPQLIHYSAVLLREPVIHFLVIVSVYYFLCYLYGQKKAKYASLSVFAMAASTSLHVGTILALLALTSYFSLRGLKIIFESSRVTVSELVCSLVVLFVLAPLIVLPFVKGYNLPNSGRILRISSIYELVEGVQYAANIRLRGSASYPEVLKFNSLLELFYVFIPRIFYLLYSPFLWDVSTVYHITGIIDGLIYLVVSYYLYENQSFKKGWWTRLVFIFFVPILLPHAFGVSNFGTAIRHRTKLFLLMVVLSGGMKNR